MDFSRTALTNYTALQERRERVFLVLAGVFLSSMTMLNVIGLTRFVQLGPMALTVGVLPYPITFLCTDLVCELYGRKRANFLVSIGLGLNFFVLFFLWLGQAIPSVDPAIMPPWQMFTLAEDVTLANGTVMSGDVELFDFIYHLTAGSVFASMLAYSAAQYCDVRLFHFWKRLTKGRHLWLRNNFSTLVSQLVDSTMVIAVTFGAAFLAGKISGADVIKLIISGYVFKLVVALLDTLPFYWLTFKLRAYLGIDSELAESEDKSARPKS